MTGETVGTRARSTLDNMGDAMRMIATVLCLLLTATSFAGTIPSPEEHFGHAVGADRRLISYPDILAYLELVDAASDRVSIEEAGTSTLGNRMPVVILTSPRNQARLPEIRDAARQLAKPGDVPPEVSRRLVEEGVAVALVTGGDRIREWVLAGGTVVALDSSAGYLVDLLELPVEDVLEDDDPPRLRCPGSTLRVHVDTRHPLGWGLRHEEAVYFADSPAFRTRVPDPRFERRVIARYPDDEKDLLLSGWLEGGELLERRAAVVEFGVGKGKVVLIGFRAQHRGQPLRTFKLLFNALYEVAGQTPGPAPTPASSAS